MDSTVLSVLSVLVVTKLLHLWLQVGCKHAGLLPVCPSNDSATARNTPLWSLLMRWRVMMVMAMQVLRYYTLIYRTELLSFSISVQTRDNALAIADDCSFHVRRLPSAVVTGRRFFCKTKGVRICPLRLVMEKCGPRHLKLPQYYKRAKHCYRSLTSHS